MTVVLHTDVQKLTMKPEMDLSFHVRLTSTVFRVSQDLIVDQTIEKVSFCAPDRNYDKAFSYICRDGTTRRWMCHCFMALKDSVRGGRAPSIHVF